MRVGGCTSTSVPCGVARRLIKYCTRSRPNVWVPRYEHRGYCTVPCGLLRAVSRCLGTYIEVPRYGVPVENDISEFDSCSFSWHCYCNAVSDVKADVC